MFLADPRNRLLKNGSLTDLTVICGAYTHKVHKAILCAHSDYFAALPNFAVSVFCSSTSLGTFQ